MPTPPSPKLQQPSSHITRKGRILAERRTAGGRAQAPVPFLHRHPANRESVEMLGRAPAAPQPN